MVILSIVASHTCTTELLGSNKRELYCIKVIAVEPVSICASFIAAILGVGYPILFQVISNLDDKYTSVLIVELFDKEKIKKVFLFFLFSALISTLLCLLKLPPLIEAGALNILVGKSAFILLVISTTGLIASFFLFIRKMFSYYTPNRFILYLIELHKKAESDELSYLKAIADVLYFSIRKENESIAKTISDFLYDEFKKIRDSSTGKAVEYPFAHHEIIYRCIEELTSANSRKLGFIETRSVGGIWLLGELTDSEISENTYNWLWRNLSLAIKYQRDDMVMDYWSHAHQYITFHLCYLQYEHDNNFQITNKEKVKKRDEERNRFLEFHYALGGLLLYRERYNCLNRIFRYTSSIPPKYELLPETMDEVFRIYFDFEDPYGMKHSWLAQKYSFPDVEGLEADVIIKRWICNYIALLFLRQYSIVPYLITMRPLEYPAIPKAQGEKRKWIDNIEFFKRLITELYENQIILSSTSLGFLNDNWVNENKKPKPSEFIEAVKQQTLASFENVEIQQDISPAKREQFNETSKRILLATFKHYSSFISKEGLTGEYKKLFINGSRTIIEKSPFAEDQDSTHLNFDSILAEMLSKKYEEGVSEAFWHMKSDSYLLKPEDFFKSIDALNVFGKGYVIVSFGVYLNHFIEILKVEGLSHEKYKDLDIITIPSYNHQLVGESFFILKRTDLPSIIHRIVDEYEIHKYSLLQIDEEYGLYTAVVDLNKQHLLREEIQQTNTEKDLNKSAIIYIGLKAELQWKLNINCVFLRLASQYRERGIPNKPSDISPI